MIKVGLKVFPNGKEFFNKIKEDIDFIEIMAVKGAKYEWLKNWKKSVVIHHEHSGFGVNFANPKKRKTNLQSMKWAQKLATKFKAKKIIVHPGHVESGECHLAETIKQLEPLKDKRIILENLIYSTKQFYMFAYNKEQLNVLCKKLGTGICFDLSHAVISANELHIKPEEYLKKLATLPVKHIHICDGRLEEPVDVHYHIGDGNFPIKKYLKCFPKGIDVTLETQRDPNKARNDIKFVKKYL